MTDPKPPPHLVPDLGVFFDATPMPLLVIAPPDWIIVAANEARLRVTGTTREAQIGRPLFEVFPNDPDDPTADGVQKLSASLQRVLSTRATDVMAVQRYAVRDPEGRFEERWWSPINTPVLDRSGAVAFIIHCVEDVTEIVRLRGEAEADNRIVRAQQAVIDRLHAAEADLRESEERLRLATDHAEVGFWDVDLVNDVLIWPPRVKAMFGISPDVPVTLRDFYEGLHPDDRERTSAVFAASADPAQRALYDVEYRTVGKEDGVVRWVAAKGRGVFDRNGRCVRVIGTAIEISARKQVEERLRELNETLEQRVEAEVARRAQAEEALRQSQKMEAVGQLTGGIAHDFNNMLAVVIGSLDLLSRKIDPNDPRKRRYVDAATEGAKRAATLTQRLLAFSRQQPLRPQAVDANKLVAGMSDLLRRALGSDVRLDIVQAGDLWRTHADPNQLENVLLNLAVNSRDAMPEGGRLTIETQNADLDERYASAHLGVPPGEYVLIAVTDTGCGMGEEVIAKAFDPFFTTKDVGKGTGLGLSQVYGFVKQSGGTVKIYSERDQGTTVKIYLPRLLATDPEADGFVAPGHAPLGAQTETILVVEDEESVRRFSVEALGELGYRVIEADGAVPALKQLDAHPDISLLFTDVVMPGMNGAKLAEEALKRRPGLKVLFTTGYTRNEVVHDGALVSGVHLLGKPYSLDELAAKVRAILDSAG